jgi:hypothetical protein
MATREVNSAERYILENYKHLMTPAERMVARLFVDADFNLKEIPKSIWSRVRQEFPGTDRLDPWLLPVRICLRLVEQHGKELKLPAEIISQQVAAAKPSPEKG